MVRSLETIVVSVVARVEVPAAIWRKEREGSLSARDADLLAAAFEADYLGVGDERPVFSAVAVNSDLLDSAAGLVAVHGLRAYDGVQLASALAARDVDPDCSGFACFDGGLRTAASRSGLTLIPS